MLTRKLLKSRQAGLAEASRGCWAREPTSPAGYAAFGCKDVLTPVGFGRLRGAGCACRMGGGNVGQKTLRARHGAMLDCEVFRMAPNHKDVLNATGLLLMA